MKIKRDTISLWGMGLGLLLLASVGVFSDRRTQDLDESNKWVSHTLEVIGDTEQVKANLIETEDSMRGYILFRRGSDLERVRELVTRIPTELLKIRQLTSDNIRQQDRLTLLEPLASRRLVLLEDEIPFATDSSEKSAELKAIYEQGQVAMQGSHKILNEMENEERMLLVNRQERATHEKSMATLLIDGGFITSILFVFGAGGLGQLEIARRHRMEAVLNTANNNITNNLHEAQERGRERSILSELAERLQSCRNLAEGLPFMARSMERLLPDESGSIFLTSASRNILEKAAGWGPCVGTVTSFSPDDCWALRRGRLQIVDAADPILRCSHLGSDGGSDVICLPLVAQGETLGVICLYCSTVKKRQNALGIEDLSLNRIRVATLAGAQISLAVANLQLRETLRNQSIRDALTGLFNRRYMEESLTREYHRAVRRKSPLAVMMIDIDHFKLFNDTYGHEHGDLLLREFGKFLGAHIRGEDIACRYGGEEFTVILPDAAIDGAARRAEALRMGVQNILIPLKTGGTSKVTVSIGLALYPEYDESPETLLRAADHALYQAKGAGRDRLAVASIQDVASTSVAIVQALQ